MEYARNSVLQLYVRFTNSDKWPFRNTEMLLILKDAVASSLAIRNVQGQKLFFVDQNVRITKV